MSDGKLREVHPNIWRGTLDGWTVEIFHSNRRWHLAIMHPKGFTRRCQPVPNFWHGAKLARRLIEQWGPAESK
jgi:hypothetical protein